MGREERIRSEIPSPSATSEPMENDSPLVYRSILSQQVPVNKLSHLEPDNPVHVIKTFMVDMANRNVDKLLEIAPALDDSVEPKVTEDVLDDTDDGIANSVIQNWFRRLVLARGQPDVLRLASRYTRIIGFLRSGVEVEELRKYVEYFENVDSDALSHFRRAVSDSYLAGNRPTMTILGGSISIDDENGELSTDQWDMIFKNFQSITPGILLPCLYMTFADSLHLSKLLLLNRYGGDWLLDEDSSLRDFPIGTFLGFVVSTQGFCDPPLPKIATEGQHFREAEFRNYVAGRMSTKDPLTERLITELKRRTGVCLLIVWKGAGLEEAMFQSEQDIFIERTRTADTREGLSDAPWAVSLDLSFVASDLWRLRSMYGETYEDYLQFLVIDRVPGLPFRLVHMIEDALMELSGDLSVDKFVRTYVEDVMPADEKEEYLEAVMVAMTAGAPRSEIIAEQVCYEGNRSRCWDANQFSTRLFETRRGLLVSVEHARFIAALCKDMESKGTIRIMDNYSVPQGMAYAVPGSDGKLDLYIDYHRMLTDARLDRLDSKFELPPTDALLDFAVFWPPQSKVNLRQRIHSLQLLRLTNGCHGSSLGGSPKFYHAGRTYIPVGQSPVRLSTLISFLAVSTQWAF